MIRCIDVAPASRKDLPSFLEMERADDTQEFILVYSLDDHEKAFSTPGIIYLGIYEEETLVGFFILAAEAEGQSVEFRRIVVRESARGIGQSAIRLMERYCRDELGCNRLWLDVFESNSRAIHVYEKLGFRRFRTEGNSTSNVAFYEKSL